MFQRYCHSPTSMSSPIALRLFRYECKHFGILHAVPAQISVMQYPVSLVLSLIHKTDLSFMLPSDRG